MATVSIDEAETQLSKLIARAESGEEIVITRRQEPVARLTAVKRTKQKLVFGAMAGEFPSIPDAFFFDPLPEDELKLWEGGDAEDTPR